MPFDENSVDSVFGRAQMTFYYCYLMVLFDCFIMNLKYWVTFLSSFDFSIELLILESTVDCFSVNIIKSQCYKVDLLQTLPNHD